MDDSKKNRVPANNLLIIIYLLPPKESDRIYDPNVLKPFEIKKCEKHVYYQAYSMIGEPLRRKSPWLHLNFLILPLLSERISL
jgi:hypothetical protein